MLVEVFLKNAIHSKQCSCVSTTVASTVSSYITSKYFFYVWIDWCISVAKGAISAITDGCGRAYEFTNLFFKLLVDVS